MTPGDSFERGEVTSLALIQVYDLS